jgi:hypothetical protein
VKHLILALVICDLACGIATAQKFVALGTALPQYPSGYDAWIAEAVLSADYHGDRWVSGLYGAGEGEVAYGQYEPWYSFRKLAEHLGGDSELEAQAVAAGDAWRDGYSVPNSGGMPGYYHYTDGLRLDWTLNADTTSRDAVIDQAVSAAFTEGTIQYLESHDSSRECAYAMLGYINSEVHCGQSHNSRMEALRDLMLGNVDGSVSHAAVTVTLEAGGHIEQWLGSYVTDSNGDYVSGTHNFDDGALSNGYEQGFAPFMGAITGWTLIQDYEKSASINGGVTPDTRTIPKLVRLFDAMWLNYWVAEDASMKYRWRNDSDGGLYTDGSVALNNEMFPIYAWLYLQTGDERHRVRAELLFNGTVDYEALIYRTEPGNPPPSYIVKEFNELLRWTFDGLTWYAEGVSTWGGS